MNIEQYLLTCLGEEGVEIAHSASKANRFGLDDVWPGKPTTNRTDLVAEFNDLVAVMELLQANGILSNAPLIDRDKVEAKKDKLSRMMVYSASRGRVKV